MKKKKIKSFLNLLQYCSCFMSWWGFLFVFWPRGTWDLSSPTRNRTHWLTRCTGRGSLNHWTTGEVPVFVSGCRNKEPRAGQLRRQKGLVSQFWGWKSKTMGVGRVGSLCGCAGPWGLSRGLLRVLFSLGLDVVCPLCISTPVSRFPFLIRTQACWIKAHTDLVLTRLSL